MLLSKIWNPCMRRSVSQSFYRFSRLPPALLYWLKIIMIKIPHCIVSLVYTSKYVYHLIREIPPITTWSCGYRLNPEKWISLCLKNAFMKCTSWHQIITVVRFLLHLALSRGDRRLVWWSCTLSGDPLLMIL